MKLMILILMKVFGIFWLSIIFVKILFIGDTAEVNWKGVTYKTPEGKTKKRKTEAQKLREAAQDFMGNTSKVPKVFFFNVNVRVKLM